MPANSPPYLLECDALPAALPADWRLVHVGKLADYLEAHLPGAVFVDIGELNRGGLPAPGLLPDLAQLTAVFARIGLTPETHVIAYDAAQNVKAARLLWVLEAAGHRHASLLNGGLIAWKNLGREIATTPTPIAAAAPVLHLNPDVIADKNYVRDSIAHPARRILDARSPDEHNGLKSASVRKGRIPNSVHFHYADAIGADNRLLAADALRAKLRQCGLSEDREIIVHCQTHQRSSHSFVALRSLGRQKLRGYAGSWSEWSADADLPIENPARE